MVNGISIMFLNPINNYKEKILLTKGANQSLLHVDNFDLLKLLLSALSSLEINVSLEVIVSEPDFSVEEISYRIRLLNNQFNSKNQDIQLISKREQEVLSLMVEGFTSKEIAEKLYISTETVKSHRKNILKKTGSRNAASLANFLVEQTKL